LSGVHFPDHDGNADIGLLMANDVPTVFDPFKVKHSQDGSPHASQMSIA